MFGSSSTTSKRASGAWVLLVLPGTTPPDGPCASVVVMPPGSALVLRTDWTVPVRTLGVAGSGCGSHRPAAPPVADRMVLTAPQTPPAAQVGADGPDGGGLRGDPGEEVLTGRAGEGGHGVGQQRAQPRFGVPAVQPPDLDAVRRGQRLLLLRTGDLQQGDALDRRRGRGQDAADRRQRRLVPGQQHPAGGGGAERGGAGHTQHGAGSG